MVAKPLLSQTTSVGPGPVVNFPTSDNIRNIQINPQINQGFSGTLLIESSSVPHPGSNDFVVIATVSMTGHTSNFSLDIQSNAPWIRARISASNGGAVSVSATSRTGQVSGGLGSSTSPTATVTSSVKIGLVSGVRVKIDSPTVPSVTSDDVFYSLDTSQTITNIIEAIGTNAKQDRIGNGMVNANQDDLNVLTGTADAGLLQSDLVKLSQIEVSAMELNYLDNVDGNIKDQLDSLNTSVTNLNANFMSVAELSTTMASVDDLNVLHGIHSGGESYSSAVTATEISQLGGINTDVNIQTQLNTKRDTDRNPIELTEIVGVTISSPQLNYLSGANDNIQNQLDDITTNKNTFTGQVFLENGSESLPTLAFTSNTDTGLYLSSDTITLSINGGRIFSVDPNRVDFGTSAADGEPSIRHAGTLTDEENPTYSFVGDNDTGMYRKNANSLGFSAGGNDMLVLDRASNTVTIGKDEGDKVEIAGTFMGEKVLAHVEVDGARTGTTSLYPVPTGRSLIVTKVLIRLVAATTGGDSDMRMNIGISGVYNQLVDGTISTIGFTGFNVVNQILSFGVGDNPFPAVSAAHTVFTAGSELFANVTTASSHAEFDMEVILFGYEF